MLPVYTITIFLSAVLLFVVQPMFARMLLPLLGGSASVWNTAMLFYQVALLAGYAYAHFATKWLGLRRQAILQLVLVGAAFVSLPFSVPAGADPPESNPVFWQLGLMGVAVGFPFFILSSTSPVVQRWFAATGHPSANDPYFLYAASNIGSLLALLAYPFAIERLVGLSDQTRLWMAGYAALALLLGGCVVFLGRALKRDGASAGEGDGRECHGAAPPLGRLRRARWVALAFAPSSLMLSVTTYLSSEVASAPLLWVFPLSIYLLTFALVFSRGRRLPHQAVLRMFPIGVVALSLLLTMRATNPFLLLALVHLVAFFLAAMACHGELANDRPEAEHLTEFYLWMSIGGALGGSFNALLAPLLFNSIAEYPLVIVAVCLLVVPTLSAECDRQKRWLDVLAPVGLGLFTWFMMSFMPGLFPPKSSAVHAAVFGPPVILSFFFSERRLRFALGVAAVFFVGSFYVGETGRVLFADRSFYGTHRVTLSPNGRFYLLVNGSTVHGMQYVERETLPTPLSYYFPKGPAGEFFFRFRGRIEGPVGVVGMGAGALASYGLKGQEWIFFEIDPVVARLANESSYFSYASQSPASVETVVGDGRLSLANQPDGRFQILIIDAFSSDVIPMHLLTREAFRIYSGKLRPDGFLLFHVSNRHFHLRPKLGDLALDAGMSCFFRDGTRLDDGEVEAGMDPSEWMLMAKEAAELGPVDRVVHWEPIREPSGARLWTDDRSSILDVLFAGKAEERRSLRKGSQNGTKAPQNK